MAAKQAKTPKAPAAPVADLLKPAKPAPANGSELTEAEVLAYLEAQEKGSEILKKARNTIWRKIASKEPDPEIKKVLDEIVKLKGFDALKLAYLTVRKEQPKAEAKESEEVE